METDEKFNGWDWAIFVICLIAFWPGLPIMAWYRWHRRNEMRLWRLEHPGSEPPPPSPNISKWIVLSLLGIVPAVGLMGCCRELLGGDAFEYVFPVMMVVLIGLFVLKYRSSKEMR